MIDDLLIFIWKCLFYLFTGSDIGKLAQLAKHYGFDRKELRHRYLHWRVDCCNVGVTPSVELFEMHIREDKKASKKPQLLGNAANTAH